MSRALSAVVVLLGLEACRASPPEAAVEIVHYVRVTAQGAVPECAFTIREENGGWSLRSETGRLAVDASYDSAERLIRAEAVLENRDAAPRVRVNVSGPRLVVIRSGEPEQEFDAPPGIIVTSAPDWADAFRICRLWKRSVSGRQEFPGLWIHPIQPAQRLTFSAERVGEDAVKIGPFELKLDRLAIRLRGNSLYAAWVDERGRMIKLAALPVREGSAVLVLEGYERPAAGLKPD